MAQGDALAQTIAIGAGKVTGTTGAQVCKTGSVAVARTGAGVYTLTGPPLPAAAYIMAITLLAVGTFSLADTSDTVKTLSTFAVDGVTATDKNFAYNLVEVIPGS